MKAGEYRLVYVEGVLGILNRNSVSVRASRSPVLKKFERYSELLAAQVGYVYKDISEEFVVELKQFLDTV